jgi:nicotinamidase-related amidase
MPLTTIDPVAALVVIDLQQGILGMVGPEAAGIVDRSAQLAAAFRERGLPVVLVNVTAAAPGRTDAGPLNLNFPDGWADLVPELGQQPGDYLVTKQRRGAFIGTSLDEILRGRGVTQIFLTGIATSAGVQATASSGHDHGYHVVFVTDAMMDRSADAHRYCVGTVFPRIGETTTTADVLTMLRG